ncbi:lamin tail domain-containing protein [Pedobacter petrophilus]|uniref:lamin tail domain-containing protein n=1 Tax=Pedobacter petrophilus TaxID=1908241 RepID=UPI00142F0042|nr:lamin tail domain-containing protein [Pedobacter petrophilus]
MIKNQTVSIPTKDITAESHRNKGKPCDANSIISQGDLLISEVLFNPRTGGVDFVEIYNNSNHEVDLKELQLANVNAAGTIANVKNVSTKQLMIAPGSYWVITTNHNNVKQYYQTTFPTHFVQISSLPAFNNDKGTVILRSNGQVLDRLNYDAKIHHPLIRDEDGISIERVSFTVATNEPGNFKSAAALAGFATPTYQNSQREISGEDDVILLSKTFSPDGDNFEDLLSLNYQVAQNSSLATVNIYSDKGKLVRKLVKNQTIGAKGVLTWDGLDDNGSISAIGIYVILFDIFDLQGNTKRFKNTCALAGKLN